MSNKIAVLYKSKYGTTRTYAKWIADKLHGDLYGIDNVTFQNLDTLIEKGNFYISIEDYKKICLSEKERRIVDEPGIYKRIVKSITVPDER